MYRFVLFFLFFGSFFILNESYVLLRPTYTLPSITLKKQETITSKPLYQTIGNVQLEKQIPSPSSSSSNPQTTSKKSSLAASSTNLLKNCIGAGVFSLSAKVNAISTDPKQFKYIVLLIFTMAIWGTYNFYLIGETCRETNSKNFGEAWSSTISEKTQWIVQSVTTIAPFVSCLANTIVLTDVMNMLLKALHAPTWFVSNRLFVVSLLVTTILFPVCIIKDLTALKSVSMIGLFGQFSATMALIIRLLDKSYLSTGKYYATANLGQHLPDIVTTTASSSIDISKWFVLASLLSYCFVTHYNAPRYYTELDNPKQNSDKFLLMTSISYFSAAMVYLITILVSNALFGVKSASFALNSFSPNDPLAIIAFLCFGISVLASYPLIFLNVRGFTLSSFQKNNVPLFNNLYSVTGLLLTLLGAITIVATDIGKVGSMSGALFGSTMMFIFPPLMYMSLQYQKYQQKKITTSTYLRQQGFHGSLLLAGVIVGCIGTYNSFLALFK